MRIDVFAEWLPLDRAKRCAIAIWSATILLTVLVVSRRAAGAFEAFPPALLTIFVSCLGLAIGIVAVIVTEGMYDAGAQNSKSRLWRCALSILPPFALGLALAPPGATGTQMSIATLAVVSTAAILLLPEQWRVASGKRRVQDEELSSLNPQLSTLDSPQLSTLDSPHCWMTRRLSDDGSREILEGSAVAEFAAGQKLAVVHVAFCPPTFALPEVECEPVGEADVRWKLNVVQPFGLRIDVTRRSNFEEAETVPIGYFASADAPQRSAA